MQSVRLLYVSRKTNQYPEVKNDLMQILNTAVDFNYRNEITGVLYYGYGYFIQCIEGPKEKIDYLFYDKILKDPRHKNCELLFYIECEDKLFKQWSMKFAPINKDLQKFFIDHNFSNFNPYLLCNKTIPHFINLLADQPNIDPNKLYFYNQ
ncbi:BLUF domain-containing protein [Acinetobacter soli]|uniref:BLUF domain-containing protein n=1 Tax=Acinetobacter soli TaxID=487316 RepID=UPI00125CA343|nr:BLUF domain-containing protein [Acinetobacter soli]